MCLSSVGKAGRKERKTCSKKVLICGDRGRRLSEPPSLLLAAIIGPFLLSPHQRAILPHHLWSQQSRKKSLHGLLFKQTLLNHGYLPPPHFGRGPKKVHSEVWSPSIKFKIQPRGRGIFKRLCFSLIPLFFSSLLVSSLLSIFELGDEVCRGSQMLRILKKRFLLEFCYLSTHTSGGMVP